MDIKQALIWARNELIKAEVSEAESSAAVLLADILELSKTELYAKTDASLTRLQEKKYRAYIDRRKNNESVWHIIGKVKFWGLDINVTQNVLVPRPETELLVQEVLKEISNSKFQIPNKLKNSKIQKLNENCKFKIVNSKISILDVGTGSGAIIIALATALTNKNSKYYIPNSKYDFFATDISKKALAVAKKNAKEQKIEKLINFVEADIFSKTSNLKPQTFDLIVANLPYIPHEEMGSLMVDVYHFEPRLALDGGMGGLEVYEKFLASVERFLKPKAQIYCEIGINQGEMFKNLAKKYLPKSKVTILGDLAGIDRIAIITSNN